MKSVLRENVGPSAPTSMSSKNTRCVTVVSSVPDDGGHPPLHQLTSLVVPFRLVAQEEHEPEPARSFVPVGDTRPLRDHVTGPDAREEGLDLTAVHHVLPLPRG